MNESPRTDPTAPENQPVSQDIAPPPSLISQPPVSYPARTSQWWRNPWLWVSAVLFVAVIGLGGYVVAQNMSDSPKNTVDTAATSDTKDKDAAGEVSKDSDTDIESEVSPAADPYKGWSSFTSRVDGVTFKYPSSMEVKEIMPTDKNQYGYTNIDTELYIGNKGQIDTNTWNIVTIHDKPWGCTGPGPEGGPASYDTLIGKEPITLTEMCGGLTTRIIFGATTEASLIIDPSQYEQDRTTIDLILASFTGVRKK